MTIWLLALLLIASTAALGYRQGVVRVAVSFLGILVAAMLAPALGKLVKPLITAFGVTNPVWPWFLGPIIMFVVISAVFKACALPLHQKVDVYFRYHAGDLRQALWERLSRRLGACLGLANGAAYFILISFLIYTLGYWSYQVTGEGDPRSVRILNRLASDLNASGFDKVARSIDRMPETYYRAADVAGLIFHNSLIEARLSRYPAFLSLGERPEFQDLGSNKEFLEMRARQEPLSALLKQTSMSTIMANPELLRTIWSTTLANLDDLRAYLETGKSAKYDSKRILGRWKFDPGYALAMLRKLRPNMGSVEMQRMRAWIRSAFDKTTIVAMSEGQIILKNLPSLKPPPAPAPGAPPPTPTGPQTLQGTWKDLDERYQINFQGKDDIFATFQVDRLTMTIEGIPLAFLPAD